jgi:hypothetical protein
VGLLTPVEVFKMHRSITASQCCAGSARDKPNSCDEADNGVRNLCVDKSKDDDESIKSVY